MKLGCHVGPFFSALPVSEPHYVIRENKLRNTRCNKFVAHPPDSDDQFGVLGILLQFLTKVPNMSFRGPEALLDT